jgi:hypothetical protein
VKQVTNALMPLLRNSTHDARIVVTGSWAGELKVGLYILHIFLLLVGHWFFHIFCSWLSIGFFTSFALGWALISSLFIKQ